MKPILTMLLLLGFNFAILNAQEQNVQLQKNKWYLQFKAGYGIPFKPIVQQSPLPFLDFHDLNTTGNSIIAKNGYSTIGDGLKTDLQIGRKLSNHIAVELGVRYSITGETSLSNINTPTFESSHTVNSQWMEVNPAIILSTGFNKKITVYSRIALAVPIFGNTTSNVLINDREGRIATYFLPVYEKQLGIPLTEAFTSQVETQLEVEAVTKGGSSLGLIAGLGSTWQIFKNVNLMLECAIQTLAIRSLEAEYTQYTQSSSINGSSIDVDVVRYNREIIFVDELTENSNNHLFNPSFSIDEPQDELRIKPDFSNVALLVGVQYQF